MEKQKRGRKLLFIEDDAVTLSIKVPSKQKETIHKMVLAFRKQYEIKR
jgi:hypothetical protein